MSATATSRAGNQFSFKKSIIPTRCMFQVALHIYATHSVKARVVVVTFFGGRLRPPMLSTILTVKPFLAAHFWVASSD